MVVAKVFICAEDLAAARQAVTSLPGAAVQSAAPSGFGTIAELELSEVLRFDFCTLPVADAARPMWRPFSRAAAAAVLLDRNDATVELGKFLAKELHLPVGLLATHEAVTDERPLEHVLPLVGDLREGLKSLLLRSLQARAEDTAGSL
jgi:hypothetical protein